MEPAGSFSSVSAGIPTLQDLCIQTLKKTILQGNHVEASGGERLGPGVSEKLLEAVGATRDPSLSKKTMKNVDKAVRQTFVSAEAFRFGKLECAEWMENKTVSRLVQAQSSTLQAIDVRSVERLNGNNSLFGVELEELRVFKARAALWLPWNEIRSPKLTSLHLLETSTPPTELQKAYRLFHYFSRSLERFLENRIPSLVSLTLCGDVKIRSAGNILGSGSALEYLVLRDFPVGPILTAIGNLHKLRHLDISVVPGGKAAMTDKLSFEQLEKLVETFPKLEHLDISGRNFLGVPNSTESVVPIRLTFLGIYKTQNEDHWKGRFVSETCAGSSIPSEVIRSLEWNLERREMLENIFFHLTAPRILEQITGKEVEHCVTLVTSLLPQLSPHSAFGVLRSCLKCLTAMSIRHKNRSESFTRIIWREKLLQSLLQLLSVSDATILYNVLRLIDLYELPEDVMGCLESFSRSFMEVDKDNLDQNGMRLYTGILNRLVRASENGTGASLLNNSGIVKKCMRLLQKLHFSRETGVVELRMTVWESLGTFLVSGFGGDEFLRLNGLNWAYSFCTQTSKESLRDVEEPLQGIAVTMRRFLEKVEGKKKTRKGKRSWKKAQRCLREIERILF